LALFRARYPKIQLRLEAFHELADVDRYEADLAARFTHTGRLDVPSELLSEGRILPFASPAFLKGVDWTPDDIVSALLFRDRRENLWGAWCLAAGFAPHHFPKRRLELALGPRC
jgi:LysR family glycine cleavage system transcriptional activator